MGRSLLSKLSFASASFTAALLNQYFQSKAEFFYITEMKLSPSSYALALIIWAIWNMVNDPLAGWYMDRNPTRFGRRLPWMMMFWLPLVISFGLIWNPPIHWVGNNLLLFLWVVIVLIIYDTAYTVVILAWAALFPEIFTSARDRNVVVGLRQVFSLFALVFALILPGLFIQDNDISSYGTFGWILAFVSFINLGLAFYGCREPKYTDGLNENKYSLREGIDLILNNKTFQAFLVSNLMTYFAYGQVLAMLPFYRNFILDETQSFETYAYASAMGVTVFALLFWVWITNKKDPRFTYLLSAFLFGVLLIPVWFIKDSMLIVIMMGFVGFALAGQLMVVDLLLADVVDEDLLKTGKRREGIFFGFNGFFIRIAIMLQGISLAVVSELTGFNEYADSQTSLAQDGIKIQFILLPVIAFFIGVFVIYKYFHLHGKKLDDQREAVAKLMANETDAGYIEPVK